MTLKEKIINDISIESYFLILNSEVIKNNVLKFTNIYQNEHWIIYTGRGAGEVGLV